MHKALSFLSGIITGALLGATIAILLAPSSGQELRDQMSNRAHQIEIEVKGAAAARRAELEQQLEALRNPKREGM
jgi:gas vesicle protein